MPLTPSGKLLKHNKEQVSVTSQTFQFYFELWYMGQIWYSHDAAVMFQVISETNSMCMLFLASPVLYLKK